MILHPRDDSTTPKADRCKAGESTATATGDGGGGGGREGRRTLSATRRSVDESGCGGVEVWVWVVGGDGTWEYDASAAAGAVARGRLALS